MKRYAFQILCLIALVLSRIPGLLPPSFSAVYGFVFCAAVFLQGRLAWWLPLGVLAITDLLIGLYYHQRLGYSIAQPYILSNYIGYLGIIGLARQFRPNHSLLKLIGGGMVGAILFFIITNTAAWLLNPFNNPEYTKDLAGWITALTKGTAGYPPTWEFFRNTLLSGGLFTGLFAGAAKLSMALEEETAEEEGELPADSPLPEAAEEGKSSAA